MRLLALVPLVAILVGCASSQPEARQFTPVLLEGQKTAPITFARVIFRIPAGTEVGHHHDGILKVKKYPYQWQSNIMVGSDEFKITASETLREQGYTVLGGDNLLFGRDESGKAAYQLGSTITDLRYDTYGSLAGNEGRAWMSVDWEVYDALAEQVVYSKTTEGSAKRDHPWGTVVQDGFRSALQNLMADETFVAVLAPKDPATRLADAGVNTVGLCPAAEGASLPEGMDAALDATVVIRVGATTGSGVVISPEGHLLTAAHVVSGVDEVVARFPSGLELTAQVIAVDNAQDIALAKLPGSGHNCLPLAGQSPLPPGSDIYAIGAPTGEELAFSVSKGVVSGYREADGRSYIQTDASLNPGNSGGPLLDTECKVVGIVSWKVAAIGYEGLAFGVPPRAISESLGISLEQPTP